MTSEINSANRYQPLIQQKHPVKETSIDATSSFADTMKEFVGQVNDMQNSATDLQARFIKGENVELHDVMIAGEEAKTSFQLLMELRTKGLDLYREVIRMQI
jgi:flagellar hook-basal body complex protein FliE